MIDEILHLDLDDDLIVTERLVAVDDPVFAGHFPGKPLYPAVLQCEAVGQSGVALANARAREHAQDRPSLMAAVQIHGAQMYDPVLPGDRMRIYTRIVEEDTLMTTFAGRIDVGERCCSVAMFAGAWIDG